MTDTKNREEFIQQNLGLVHACAGRFRSRGIEYDDLYAAGCVGLIKAYDGFDWGRGVCFSTYAVPVILGEIKKLFRDGGTVKVSRSVKELGIKASAVREKLLKEMGSEPTVSQIAQRLNASAEQVAMALKAGLPAISLTPAGENDGNRELDIPIDSPEEELTDRISLQEVMQRLSPEEQKLIRLRYFCGRTQSETARMLNTTQVQISRRERKLLGLMRRQLIGG
ncbi:MAG: sigma-70 family RNA polymerase sigma factor [Subdoligranulum sp.]|nr:sigma-70 family RNA polymerase sigma factor [Subdoligranulum sp.]MCI7541463.1 sigma-70 family RNA polymerase sigma factor [Subdoligranulum sp.]MDD7265670.1 sigma-70 family RNA polymerase sigma factor [Subdoligranulum sp.]MDY5922633.1 sigma-70 family RNA polymerase sigma factor [Oscillospiraceae bacterium]